MSNEPLRNRILEEVQKIPETKLEEVINLLHPFSLSLASSEPLPVSTILSFAGVWSDMDESTFRDFEEEIRRRRGYE
ncbi:hypothetical protein LFE_0135 [Leptospirillum ferrooxidans C2-3]|jgi:hypothetical protein|uniref:DUF2281 domain-containing protein n=1 Tax=Leptospirillum ferrooxidans (strain C2-3) TaxID=1162668 RepID=I0IKR4_LEPFC|nr:hypothetical protein LFE_0135 [Leptospirillum ferrooxidans C2-3]